MLPWKSKEIAPERMKRLGQSRNDTQLRMCLVVNVNGLEWVNLIQMTIISTTVGKNPLEEME